MHQISIIVCKIENKNEQTEAKCNISAIRLKLYKIIQTEISHCIFTILIINFYKY